jgi:hypothetical protein
MMAHVSKHLGEALGWMPVGNPKERAEGRKESIHPPQPVDARFPAGPRDTDFDGDLSVASVITTALPRVSTQCDGQGPLKLLPSVDQTLFE